jgi:hypothetical protein
VGDNKFSPKGNFTRAEILQTIYNGVFAIADANVTGASYDKSVVVRKPGITLTGVTVKGSVIAGDGIGEGDLTLDGATVSGDIVAFGDGTNSIVLKATKVTGAFKSYKTASPVRVSVDTASTLEKVVVGEDSQTVIAGKVHEVVIPSDAEGFTITLTKTAKVDVLTAEAAGTISAEKGAVVTAATIKADSVNIAGSGKFTTLTIADTVEKPGTVSSTTTGKIVNNSDAPIVNEKGATVVKPDSSATKNEAGSSGGGGGGSGGGGTVTPTYPQTSTKFAITSDTALGFDSAGITIAEQTQTAENAYTVKLTGSVAAPIWGDYINDGGFKENYLGGNDGVAAGVETGKTGFSGSALAGYLRIAQHNRTSNCK